MDGISLLILCLIYQTASMNAGVIKCGNGIGECSITKEHTAFCKPTSKEVLEFPSLPTDLGFSAILSNKSRVPFQRITWRLPQDGTHADVQGFRLDSFRMDQSSKDSWVYCLNQPPSIEASFEHNINKPHSLYHEFHVLPEREPRTDYLHRVIDVYKQVHNEQNTAVWAPAMLEIHNASCDSSISLKFTAPPPSYGFDNLKIVLYSPARNREVAEIFKEHDIDHSGDIKHDFTGLPNDIYIIRIFMPAFDTNDYCKKRGQPTLCDYVSSSEITIDANHPKCQHYQPSSKTHPTTQSHLTTPSNSQIYEPEVGLSKDVDNEASNANAIFIGAAIVCVAMGLLVATFLGVRYVKDWAAKKRCQKENAGDARTMGDISRLLDTQSRSIQSTGSTVPRHYDPKTKGIAFGKSRQNAIIYVFPCERSPGVAEHSRI